ncbi:MAG TPA: sigma-54 dependent transcriptional regulator, partial [Pyrinomonadaceae bacterium]|nr:sigma-54 dependent transcriptional regulator [Pyrinomonadaceae bacterium]
MPRILIADDRPDVLEALRFLLKSENYEAEAVNSPDEVLRAVEAGDFDIVLIDLNYARDTTAGREGLDLLTHIRSLDQLLPVVVMTAWGSVDLAVDAMRHGACDFIQKPWDNARLLTVLRTQAELGRALRKAQQLEAENKLHRGDGARPVLIAESAAMRPVMDLIARVGPSDANILITGENGTGKEVVARLLHARSLRAAKPLLTLNAGSLSENIIESELFGHVRGAFTDAKTDRIGRFELADTGTLFLDEIANAPLSLQSNLLRVLEFGEFERVGSSKTRRVNVRIISATNADLSTEVEAGRFRQDLFFRLNTVEIRLPPLRDRREDIPLLAAHFLRVHASRYRRRLKGFEPSAEEALSGYSWPGNVREMSHVVERAVLMAQGEALTVAELDLLEPRAGAATRLEEMSIEEVERMLIQKALARYEGSTSRAAEAL